MHNAKNADFPAKTADQGQRGRPTKMKSRQDVADLTNPELPGLNRFSNHGLHSDVLTQIHAMPGSTTVTSLGRVISVRGSLARVGLLATSQLGLSEVRATVGRFVSIRCATTSTIIAMITEVSCENLPTSDIYIATASVDLLGEILGGPERPKFQRGVTNYPTIASVIASSWSPTRTFARFMHRLDRIRSMSARCSRIARSSPMSMSRSCSPSISRYLALPASANRPASRCC